MTLGSQAPIHFCIDAKLVLRLLLPYERDADIAALWSGWRQQRARIVGPPLLYAEVLSTMRLRVASGRLSTDEGEAAFTDFTALGIQRIDRDDLYPRAWELARRYNQRRAYDMLYLALAQLEDIAFWTGDERLVNTVGGDEPRVRWLPTLSPPGAS